MNFRVGDRVESLLGNGVVKPGDRGTVCSEERDGVLVRVRWDRYVGGHSCGGNCQQGYGWNLEECDIRLVPEHDEPFPAYSDADVLSILYG